jgi:hypothetical protein
MKIVKEGLIEGEVIKGDRKWKINL